MEWRCEWCGKPHDENDPPCDNCGHGTFEKAVVPVADSESELGTEATVWVCTECGREHTKHTPPCSRCGNEKLVRQHQEVDDAELTAPGYLDLLTPRYVLGLVAVLALAALFVLGLTGVIALPGFGNAVPDVSDVPGSDTAIDGVTLSDVETAYLARINDERTGANASELASDDRLDEVATFVNQRVVKTQYADGSLPERERIAELVAGSCQGGATLQTGAVAVGVDDTASDVAAALAESNSLSTAFRSDVTKIGVDVHAAPDGTVVLTQIAC